MTNVCQIRRGCRAALVAGVVLSAGRACAEDASWEHVQAIYAHLVSQHGVPQTGLFLSFVDGGDSPMAQQVSTRDLSMVGLLALEMRDVPRAQGIFRFLKRQWDQAPRKVGAREDVLGLAASYNADFGVEGIDSSIDASSSAWAALFAARLAERSKNRAAFRWALEVARWMAHDIPCQGGSYAVLLAQLQKLPWISVKDQQWLKQEQSIVEQQLVKSVSHANAPIALEAVAELVSVLGPDPLRAAGIDPDLLMKKTTERFEVQLDDQIGVDPADQAEADFIFAASLKSRMSNLERPVSSRHRMIWYVGSAEYAIACSLMAEAARAAGRLEEDLRYRRHADRLINGIDRASLSRYGVGVAYPYATEGRSSRNGWESPLPGPQGPASSLATAAYRCFIELGVDPLSGKSIGATTPIRHPKVFAKESLHRSPNILYGSSDSMIARAAEEYAQEHYGLAIRQAEATISEWDPLAQELQERKKKEVGGLIVDTHRPEAAKKIFSYGALNDVAAAYCLLAKVADEQGDSAKAAKAFTRIQARYSLAQIWDRRQWRFWSPLESRPAHFTHG